MFVPYRVKNPPLAFPYATICLIVINTLVFALTCDGWGIRESVMENWAMSHDTFGPIRMFTSMFLHADWFHLISNMLFLWVFGAAVEGRIGIPLYLGLYIISGRTGSLTHDLVMGVLAPSQYGLGASGAIMGLMGAYLYLSPFAQVMIAYFFMFGFRVRAGITTWQAQWLIGLFLVKELFNGYISHEVGISGVGHFAHLGGMFAGFLLLLLSGMTRESEDYADAQATRSDMGGHLLAMNQYELQSLMEGPSATPDVVLAYSRKCLTGGLASGGKQALEAFTKHAQMLLDRGDPNMVAVAALQIPSDAGRLPGPFLLKLAAKLENNGDYALAENVYHALLRGEGGGSEAEMALARLARLTEQTHADKGRAAAIWAELLRRFPDGPQSAYARQAVARLGQPTVAFSAGSPIAAANPEPEPADAPATPGFAPLGGIGGMAGIGTVGTAPAAAPAPVVPPPLNPSPASLGDYPIPPPLPGMGSKAPSSGVTVGSSPGTVPPAFPPATPTSVPATPAAPALAPVGTSEEAAASLLRPIGKPQ